MKLSAPLLAAVLGLTALLDPGVAAAATRHHRAHHAAAPSYPMKADEYRTLMEKRIDGVRAIIDRKLDRRGVSAERKKAIHKIFDEASRDLRSEIARAAADGTVTQTEADRVKPLVTGLRAKVRERLRAEKDPAAKAKLTKEEAARREREKARDAAAKKPASARSPEGSAGDAKFTGPVPAKHAKAKPAKAKKGGPTKQAKASPGKTRKPPEADPGANL
jgi:hypothetical protein